MNTTVYSQQLYTEKIHRAIDYITGHLSEEITLEQLSNEACFSPFHFHRIFTAHIGETPRDFIERIKLERAANNLFLRPHKTISEIAIECGFSSASTFTRAFKKYYTIPPREFIEKHIHDFHSLNVYHPRSLNAIKVSHYIKIERLPAVHVAYHQTLNGYATGIPKSWNKLLSIATFKGLINDETRFIGVPYDNPGITPKEKCRYRACISVDQDISITRGEVKTTDLEGGNYAIFHFKGKRENISDAYGYIYGDWLPQSGYIPDNIPLLELYPPALHTQCYTELLEYDIALPVTLL